MRSLFRQLLVSAFVFAPLVAFAGAQNFQVAIEGMTCADCAKAVSMALEKIPDIDKSSVKVSLTGKTATLKMNDSNKETQALVKKAIEDAGYTVKSVKTVPSQS